MYVMLLPKMQDVALHKLTPRSLALELITQSKATMGLHTSTTHTHTVQMYFQSAAMWLHIIEMEGCVSRNVPATALQPDCWGQNNGVTI
jgi:hypothetical protein